MVDDQKIEEPALHLSKAIIHHTKNKSDLKTERIKKVSLAQPSDREPSTDNLESIS